MSGFPSWNMISFSKDKTIKIFNVHIQNNLVKIYWYKKW